jgi:hypothetical protein
VRDVEVVKTVLLALLAGCAPAAMTTTAEHPAHPDAPTGRLAGPPPALRPGAADVSTPGDQAKPPASQQTPGKARADEPQPAPPAHQGHEGHL